MESMEMIDCQSEMKKGVTILDVFGVDICRDAILDYVHIMDILRSERVCRRWQQAVLHYIPRCNLTLSIYQRSRVFKQNHRTVMIRDDGTFQVRTVLEKLGPLIVSLFTNRSDREFYEHVSSYCPRLRQIELKHLSTRGAHNISEQKLGRAFQNIELEKVKLINSDFISGKCLNMMNFNSLKYFSLVRCDVVQFCYLETNAFRLQNLTTLEICSSYLFPELLMLLDRMPKLENLRLQGPSIDKDKLLEQCSRLNDLKCLDLRKNCVDDDFLEGIARSCKKLECLNIAGSINSPYGRGLAALVLRSLETSLCFTRVSRESLEALLEFLKPLNDEFEGRRRDTVTLEALNEAFELTRQRGPLELRLTYPESRNAKSHPKLKIILNVLLVRIADVPENINDPDDVDVQDEWE